MQLPPGFEALQDEASGQTYYFHPASGETRFTFPDLTGTPRPFSEPCVHPASSPAQRSMRSSSSLSHEENSAAQTNQTQCQFSGYTESFAATGVGSSDVTAAAMGWSSSEGDDGGSGVGGVGGSVQSASSRTANGSARQPDAFSRRSTPATLTRLAARTSTRIFGAKGSAAPCTRVRPRELFPHRVEQVDNQWRVVSNTTKSSKQMEVLGVFTTCEEAVGATSAIVPPIPQPAGDACSRCNQGFALLRRRARCRNCGFSFCHACCTHWPRAALPPAFLSQSDSGHVRVCVLCEARSSEFRQALLSGDLDAVVAAYADGAANLNLRSPVVIDGQARMLPVHCAAACDALPVLKWLCIDKCCPLQGPTAMSAGKAQKSVLRVAIERAAVDVLQWMCNADDAPVWSGVPMRLPADAGCSAAALTRALEAALRDGWAQRNLITLTLDQASAIAQASTSHTSQLDEARRANDETTECVVCLSAPRDYVLVPCGHNCVCEDCCYSISSCPLCREPVERAVKLYAA